MTWLVLAFAVGLTVAGTLLTRSVVQDQERRLLHQRAEEANQVLAGAAETLHATLASLAGTAQLVKFDPQAFGAILAPLTSGEKPTYAGAALVKLGGDGPQVVASGGAVLHRGDVLSGPRATTVQDALRAATAPQAQGGGIAGSAVFMVSGQRHFTAAYVSKTAPGYAVFTESVLHPYTPQSSTTSNQAFKEISVAVYVGKRVTADQLLLANVPTDRLPLRGQTASDLLPFGGGPPWLLVAKPRQPLVGSVAMWTPWGLLMLGLVATGLVAWTVEVLSRRRKYALDLVAERTAELEASLQQLSATQRQLVRQERLAAIGELASTIGHELRNPLGVLSNALYLLRTDLGPSRSERADRHLATADREVAAASLIVSDLLEFARAREPAPIEFDVGVLVDEVLSVAPPPSGIRVERDAPPTRVTLSADRDQLRQVLLNLVGNAVQAMEGEGTLRLVIEAPDGAVRLLVSDTGVGMSPSVRSQVFEPFFTTKARGVGLGLAVTRRIVEAHGGDIDVTSTPDEGTTFTVILPRVMPPRPRTQERATPSEVLA